MHPLTWRRTDSQGRYIIPGVKEFHWLGFRGRADDLGRAGWQVAEEVCERSMYERHQVLLHHPMGYEAVGNFDLRRPYTQQFYEMGYPWVLPIHLDHISRQIWLHGYDPEYIYPGSMPIERPVNPRTIGEKMRGIRVARLFPDVQPGNTSSSILLEEATLDDVLKYALKKQQPRQEELYRQRAQQLRVAAQLVV